MWFCIPRFSGIPFGGNLLLSCMGIILSLGCTRPEPGELPPPTPRETVSEMPFVLSKVQIGPFETVLEAGSSLQIPVNLFDEAGSPFPDRALSWASQDTRIASIDKNGVLTAHAPGFSTVTVNVKGLSDSIKIQVVPPPIAHIEIRPSVTRLPIGERQAYFIFATDSRNKELPGLNVQWYSKNAAVARVDSEGRVTGLRPGKARIVAKANDRVVSFRLTILPVSNN